MLNIYPSYCDHYISGSKRLVVWCSVECGPNNYEYTHLISRSIAKANVAVSRVMLLRIEPSKFISQIFRLLVNIKYPSKSEKREITLHILLYLYQSESNIICIIIVLYNKRHPYYLKTMYANLQTNLPH